MVLVTEGYPLIHPLLLLDLISMVSHTMNSERVVFYPVPSALNYRLEF